MHIYIYISNNYHNQNTNNMNTNNMYYYPLIAQWYTVY